MYPLPGVCPQIEFPETYNCTAYCMPGTPANECPVTGLLCHEPTSLF